MSPSPIVSFGPDTTLTGEVTSCVGSSTRVYSFLGIPYAEPPVGKLRFKPPAFLKLWKGNRAATKYGPVCPQNLDLMKEFLSQFPVPDLMSEDCLYLNIWTPSLNLTERLPVMVWIHGGSFIMGYSNIYDGTAIAAYGNVIHVSINYRLGPFGFLSTGDASCPGNMGLWDQLMSLQWIQKYIHLFGGDPENVTLYGESAGAISIDLLLNTHHSRGLFHRVILQSGTAMVPSTTWPKKNAVKYITKSAKKLGCTSLNITEIFEYLKTLPAKQLLSLGDGFQAVQDDILFVDTPERLYQKGSPAKVDVITGVTGHEGAMFVYGIVQTFVGKSVTPDTALNIPSKEIAKQIFDFCIKKQFFRGQSNLDKVVNAVYDHYIDPIKDDDVLTISKRVVDVLSHVLFVIPNITTAKHYSALAMKTYMYLFDYKPSVSHISFPDWVNTAHAEEIPFVIGEPFLNRIDANWSEDDKKISKQIMQFWTNFAKNGSPQNHSTSRWNEFGNDQEYLHITKDRCDMKSNLCTKDYIFWTQTIPAIMQGTSSKY